MLTEMATDDNDNNRLSFNPRNSFRTISEESGRALVVAKKVTTVASAAWDAYKIGRAIHTDITKTRNERPGKRTIKASASVAGGWTGSTLGGAIGTAVGTLFGGAGAVPGGIVGGMLGSFAGSFTAEQVVDEYVSSDSEDENA